MEQDKKKRAREEEEGETKNGSFENNKKAKNRDLYGVSFMKDKEEVEEEKGCFEAWDSSRVALGVFDFPWLKDGVISKSEEYCFLDFEDNFSSSLELQKDTSFGTDFAEAYGLFEIPESSTVHIPEARLVENVLQPFESNGLELDAEDVDCIWSSLLNKPL